MARHTHPLWPSGRRDPDRLGLGLGRVLGSWLRLGGDRDSFGHSFFPGFGGRDSDGRAHFWVGAIRLGSISTS
ncbi:hypothetical protein P280DRAFT_470178 [Massarina eburnea CBS 473.64]|uniref:Uncharacterized protein n=1 Tax=Massarina eburnea CBS 473.64 TaxID=1395130 RepID=A0A6A6RWL5_9PLEO|nr:hypothetical protein P280DRAFT_470178 [Massarina eburnea CBS 473.64]